MKTIIYLSGLSENDKNVVFDKMNIKLNELYSKITWKTIMNTIIEDRVLMDIFHKTKNEKVPYNDKVYTFI